MATNLAIDDELICAAKELGGHKTKREAVTAALREYVRKQQVEQFLALEGTIDYDDDYDYKTERRRSTERLLLDFDASSR